MKVFYSYCHKDEQYREKLETFLCTLKDRGKITEWHDRKIIAGENWSEKIQNELENADIILLLISQDFLASDACKKELDYAFDETNHKLAIPIILKPCMWLDTKIKKIQAIYKKYPTSIRVYDEGIVPLDLLSKLDKQGLKIIHFKTIETNVEEYYLSMIGGNKNE